MPKPSAAPANPDTTPKGFLNLDYPKRLIEVDLPIKRISAHARREKSIRHGHISTLHIWWARRPLAACRAVICAALWPDPADENCPPAFREEARRLMTDWAKSHLDLTSRESMSRFNRVKNDPKVLADNVELRKSLLDFIADFANWDNSTHAAYLRTCRALTLAAHETLTGDTGELPLVVDPFAGGGAIPLEALRIGADAFASDLNPLPFVLNKVVLQYIPKYGQELAERVRTWGAWIRSQAEEELGGFFPSDLDGAVPIAYLWARSIKCEGPGCGAEVPLVRSLWLAKKANHAVALHLLPDPSSRRVSFQIICKDRAGWHVQDAPTRKVAAPQLGGTVKRGSATCPCCGYTTPVARIREQLRATRGGASKARLMCVVTSRTGETGRYFRLPNDGDFAAVQRAEKELQSRLAAHSGEPSLTPEETLPLMSGVFNAPIYGHDSWASLFTPRQLLTLTTLCRLVRDLPKQMADESDTGLVQATQVVLALGVSRIADIANSLCTWKASMVQAIHLFTRQAIPMMWDFTETAPFSDAAGDYGTTISNMLRILEGEAGAFPGGQIERCSATSHPLPEDACSAVITDPPYYNAVPYADLSDFFYVWLRRMLLAVFPDLYSTELSPKTEEVCQMSGWDPARYAHKTSTWFEHRMQEAMAEARRILKPEGIGVVVFAHKSTAGWESQLQAMIDAGWVMTGSWPIDTELGNRLRAVGSAALASSVHIVCRARENPDGSIRQDDVGDWRTVLAELPKRIHEWMPRLAEEGVVGADAIFACLGPALEIFSRYSRVEKASGEVVTLREYLEQVWAAVSTEALSMIFRDADAAGLESDARFTAIVLWTLGAGGSSSSESSEGESEDSEEEDDEDESPKGKGAKGGFTLEYDAARKIAQGLGVNLEQIDSVVEVKGDKARLRSVSERAASLFGKAEKTEAATKKRGKKATQKKLFDKEAEEGGGTADTVTIGEGAAATPGITALDRVHQAMLLFASGRADALKRFIVEDGVGGDARFWKLAQSLSALYPAGSDEKRWVDGVLARKKSFGF